MLPSLPVQALITKLKNSTLIEEQTISTERVNYLRGVLKASGYEFLITHNRDCYDQQGNPTDSCGTTNVTGGLWKGDGYPEIWELPQ